MGGASPALPRLPPLPPPSLGHREAATPTELSAREQMRDEADLHATGP